MTTAYTMNGKTQSLSDWAKEYGMNIKTLHQRLTNCDDNIKKALLKPIFGSVPISNINMACIQIGKKIEIRYPEIQKHNGRSKCFGCNKKILNNEQYILLCIGSSTFRLCKDCANNIGDALTLLNQSIENQEDTKIKIFGAECSHQLTQTDSNGDVVLVFCDHKDNPQDTEGNCFFAICPKTQRFKKGALSNER